MVLMAEKNVTFSKAAFDAGCKWHKRIYPGYIVAGVGVVGAVVSLIMLSRDPEPADARGKKPSVAFTPYVSLEAAGAALSLAW
jgi:hypothetical protein